MSLRARLAVPEVPVVFRLVGDGGQIHARRLLADPRVRLARSPRHATVLLVLGTIPEVLHEDARRVHDQLPVPCTTIVFDPAGQASGPFPDADVVSRAGDVAEAVVRAHRELLAGERSPDRALGPEDSPVAWQGVGPHGQGGEGMTGGKPYGRAMAVTGPDARDGLELDGVAIPLGPFLRWLPPGIFLDLVLQGDVVQEAQVHVAPFQRRDEPEVFCRALREDVALSELELERARCHLFATAEILSLHGLEALAVRVARLAVDLGPGDEHIIHRLTRWLRWTGALRIATRGVGVLDAKTIEGWAGPVARAAGISQDARASDPAYQALGFVPIVREGGDAEARWQQRLLEAAQSVSLARRAGDRARGPGPAVEGPRGVVGRRRCTSLCEMLERTAVGQAFDAFATTIVSLDLDASDGSGG